MQRQKSHKVFTGINEELVECGEIESAQIERLKTFYLDFANKKKYPDNFKTIEHSFEAFKQSTEYQKLSDTEKARLEKDQPKKVIILRFNSLEEAKECLLKMEQEGILKPGMANKYMMKLTQSEKEPNNSRRPGR